MRVLLVEDDDAQAELVQQLLHSDWSLTVAGTVERATELVRERRFDVAVLDHRLPDGTGLELLSEIRRIEPGLPVVFFTGAGDERVAMEALGRGAVEYLVKDLGTLETLSDTLAEVVDEWAGIQKLATPAWNAGKAEEAAASPGWESDGMPEGLSAYLEASEALGLALFDRGGRLIVSQMPEEVDGRLLATRAAALVFQAQSTAEAANLNPTAHATFLQNNDGLLVLASGPAGRLLALLLPAETGPLPAMRRVQEAVRILEEEGDRAAMD